MLELINYSRQGKPNIQRPELGLWDGMAQLNTAWSDLVCVVPYKCVITVGYTKYCSYCCLSNCCSVVWCCFNGWSSSECMHCNPVHVQCQAIIFLAQVGSLGKITPLGSCLLLMLRLQATFEINHPFYETRISCILKTSKRTKEKKEGGTDYRCT